MGTTTNTLQIVITLGQSLTTGFTADESVLSISPRYPDKVLGLDFGPQVPATSGWRLTPLDERQFRGFAPLVETGTETHISGMMDALVAATAADGGAVPTFLHINAGAGGRSILQLSMASDEIFSTLAEGLAETQAGDTFAVLTSTGRYDTYLRTPATALLQSNISGPLPYFDNLDKQLDLAVAEAQRLGLDVAPTVVLNWIQGQADNSTSYDAYLTDLVRDFERVVQDRVGPDAEALVVVSQTRGTGAKTVPLDQLQVIEAEANVVFGASEFEYQARFPSEVGVDHTHLRPQGYFLMGQRIGRNIHDALAGKENQPILIDTVEQIDARNFIVRFSGVDSHLVDDPGRFAAASGMRPPPNFGFGVYAETGSQPTGFAITSASIVGTNSVRLTFGSDVTSNFTLFLGRTSDDLSLTSGYSLSGHGGTTLRDAGSIASLAPASGTAIADAVLYEYAPIQSQLVLANRAPVLPRTTSLRLSENTLVVTDFNASDDRSREGAGLRYALAGGSDQGLFGIDANTGILRFLAAPDFEKPADSNRDNIYAVSVSVRDELGVTVVSTVTVTIADLNEAPSALTLGGSSVDRTAPAGTSIGTLAGVDPDAASTLRYALVSNPDGIFGLDAITGRLFVADATRLAGFGGAAATISARVSDAAGLSLTAGFAITIAGQSVPSASYTGTASDDVQTYTGTANWLASGGDGADRLTGSSGDDEIRGGNDLDRLTGNDGADTLYGDAGNDILSGGNGNDRLFGGEGNDRPDGGAGADLMVGGSGDDSYTVDDAGDLVIEVDALGNDDGGLDRVTTSIDYTLPAGVELLTLSGTAAINGTGNALANTMTGNAADNMLWGGLGADRLSGSAGDDTLIGGLGRDVLTGGSGADRFVIDAPDVTYDTIVDFEANIDTLVLGRALFGATPPAAGPLDAALFATGTAATTAEQRLIYSYETGTLRFDPDGNGPLAAMRLITFTTPPELGYPDIIIG